jgi:hypothetical protein
VPQPPTPSPAAPPDSAPSPQRPSGPDDGESTSVLCGSPPAPSVGISAAPPKLKSVLVIPDRAPTPHRRQRKQVWKPLDLNSTTNWRWELEEPSGVNESPEWQGARRRRWWRKPAALESAMTENKQDTGTGASTAREAFLRRLDGRCFRCLASDHHVAQCRDPIRCLRCK